jgi:hypothetical protein
MADCVAIESYGCEKAGYEVNGTVAIVFFAAGFRASRALIQAMYWLQ